MSLVGRTISHYQILEMLGSGGMGEVYKARDVTLGRLVALKFLKPHIVDDEQARKRFEHEARAASALDHRSVTTIYEIGQTEDHRTFIAMAYYAGESLTGEISRGPLPLERALDVAIQVGEGLAEAHRHDIIHRDVKPGNVIVTDRGDAKIVDFGLARAAGQTKLTQSGATVGTIGYMSPEQAQGRDVDRRTDIWALGALLYESLVSRPPFEGTHEQAVVYSIINLDPQPLTAQRAGLPLEIDHVIAKALAKNPDERFQSMEDMLVDLRRLRAGAKSTGTTHVTARGRPRRSRGMVWLVFAAGLALGVVAGLLLSRRMFAVKEPETPLVSIVASSGSDRDPASAPDGRTIAFASSRSGVSQIWLKQLGTGNEVAITGGDDAKPRFSPDGSQVLFTRRDGPGSSLWRVSTVGGSARALVDDATEGAWSPDGSRLAYLRVTRTDTSEVWVAQADASNPKRVYHEWGVRLRGLSWSPDGSVLIAPVDVPYVPQPIRFLVIPAQGGSVRSVDPELGLTQISNVVWLDSDRVCYAIIGSLFTSFSGQASRVVDRSLSSGAVRDLMSLPASCTDVAVLGEGSLLIGLTQQSQNLLLIENPGTPRRSERWLTRGGSTDRQPVFSPDGRRILFSSNRSGNLDVWEMNLDSGALTRLTDDPGNDWDPSYTIDGKSFLWSSNRTGNFEIWSASIDGSGVRQVSHTGTDAQNPIMTSDGQWILYLDNRSSPIGTWKLRVDGSEPQLVASDLTMPVPSPDADLFAAAAAGQRKNRSLRVYRLGDGTPLSWEIPLAQRFDVLPGRSRWMGARQLAYVDSDPSGRVGITVREVSDSAVGPPRRLAGFDPLAPTESFDVTADGSRIVVSVRSTLQSIASAANVPGIGSPSH